MLGKWDIVGLMDMWGIGLEGKLGIEELVGMRGKNPQPRSMLVCFVENWQEAPLVLLSTVQARS